MLVEMSILYLYVKFRYILICTFSKLPCEMGFDQNVLLENTNENFEFLNQELIKSYQISQINLDNLY
jgi:hypothetical protein